MNGPISRAEAAPVITSSQILEPGPPLAIVERMGGVYLGDVWWRMELATFFEWQA
jgi:hypothetical protein